MIYFLVHYELRWNESMTFAMELTKYSRKDGIFLKNDMMMTIMMIH